MTIPFLSTFAVLPYEDKLLNLIIDIQDKNLTKIEIINELSKYKIENEKINFKLNELIENLFLLKGDFSKIKIVKTPFFKLIGWEINSHLYITGCRTIDFFKKNGKPINHNKKNKNKQVRFFNQKFKIDSDLMLLYHSVTPIFYNFIRDFTNNNILQNKTFQNYVTLTGFGPDACFFQLMAVDLKLYSTIPFYINFFGFEIPRKYNSNFEYTFRQLIEGSHLINTNLNYKNKSCSIIQSLNTKIEYKSKSFLFWRCLKTPKKIEKYNIYEFAFFFKIRTYKMPDFKFINTTKPQSSPPTHMKITKKVRKEDLISNQI